MFSRSLLIRSALVAGVSTNVYSEVSSANSLIVAFMSFTISFMAIYVSIIRTNGEEVVQFLSGLFNIENYYPKFN